jgi:hypothetical protein
MNYCCFIDIKESDMSKYSFIADSGASCHSVKDTSLLTNFIPEGGKVKVGDSRLIPSYGYGTYKGIHTNQDGIKVKIALNKVLYVPNLWKYLFVITAATSLGKQTLFVKSI